MEAKAFRIAIATLLTGLIILVGCSSGSPVLPSAEAEGSGTIGSTVPEISPSNQNSLLASGLRWIPGEVLVSFFENAATGDQVESFMSKFNLGLIEKHVVFYGEFYQFSINDNSTVNKKCDEINASGLARICEPNYLMEYCGPQIERHWPNDPYFESPWDEDVDRTSNTRDQWGPHQLGADLAWPDYTGEGVVIAIIDTGVNPHEDLDENLWINEDEIPDNGIDDDNNGFIDDINGWDFDGNDNDMNDNGFHHGTECAGVAAARGDNELGLSGIAPRASIMPIRAHMFFSGPYISTVIDSINYAYANGADILSMSFGGWEYSQLMEEACINAWNDGNGSILAAAAGNENNTTIRYPSRFESVLTVGATVSFDGSKNPRVASRVDGSTFGWGSCYGDELEVMAPGQWYTTVAGAGYDVYRKGDGDYDYFSGTSNATPCVSGSLAVIMSAHPEWTPAEIRERINKTADDIHEPGKDIFSGMGRVNIYRAIYGSDPIAYMEEPDGFVPVEPNQEYNDTIHFVTGSEFMDEKDFFKFTTPIDVTIDLDIKILTWGEDLILSVYDNPSLSGAPVSMSDVNNNPPDIHEHLTFEAYGGNSYYIVVAGKAEGVSTTYILYMDGDFLADEIMISVNSSPETEFTVGDETAWLGNIKFEALSGAAELDEVTLSLHGDLLAQYVDGFTLWDDTNSSGVLEPLDDTPLFTTDAFLPTNRSTLEFGGILLDPDSPLEYMISVPILLGATDGGRIGIGISNYKDAHVSIPNYIRHSNLPQFTNLKTVIQPDVLFVDDDAGNENSEWYTPHLDSLGLHYLTVEIPKDGSGPSGDILSDFSLVIWETGPDWFTLLTPDDRVAIEEFLNSGGKLLISSRDMAWESTVDGYETWLADVLHTTFIEDDSNGIAIDGVDGDPVTGDMPAFPLGGGLGNSTNWYDQIAPANGGIKMLEYIGGTGGTAGIRYSDANSRLIFLGFPVEALTNFNERKNLLERCINWLQE